MSENRPDYYFPHDDLPAPDARTFDQMDADDAVHEEAVREIALGLPGRPGVIR